MSENISFQDAAFWRKKADLARKEEVKRRGHWFDQLAVTKGEEVPFEYITSDRAPRRIAVRRG